MESINGKKKLTINLSLFTNLADSFALSYATSPNKSPRIFQNTSVVGLSIVAAMTNPSNDTSENIPVVFSSAKKPRAVNLARQKKYTTDVNHHQVDELSESYTCVISHFGNNLAQKRVFFDDAAADVIDVDDDVNDKIGNYTVFFASSSPMNVGFEVKREFWSRDFLSSCFLCNKNLHGLDIFMYSGEKAFCSAECRDKQIKSDDLKDNCGSEARKQLDYSVSPCSGPQLIGVAVA